MPTTRRDPPLLRMGDCLTDGEFLRRWHLMPYLKHAELIGGVVCMPPPVTAEHGDLLAILAGCLAHYGMLTPGCRGSCNATCLMDGDVPQPDVSLRILPSHGGQSRVQGRYLAGAPEMVAEVCTTGAAYDLHQKRDLYERAGVREYVALVLWEKEVRWHRRAGDRLTVVPPPPDGTYRSEVFAGLWLHAPALLAGDDHAVFDTLHRGMASAEYARFRAHLAARAADPDPPLIVG